MAEAKFSGIGVVNLNGSIGNTTFARNFYGTYAKGKIGAPAGSPYLTAWQTTVASVADVWQHGMTDADRSKWYTVSRVSPDSIGDKNIITGFQLFMSVNLDLILCAGTPTIVPPSSFERIQTVPLIVGTHSLVGITIKCGDGINTRVCLYASKPLPAGRMSNNQIYGFLKLIVLDPFFQPIGSDYVTRFGAYSVGQKIFFKIVPISQTSGLRGVPQYTSTIII